MSYPTDARFELIKNYVDSLTPKYQLLPESISPVSGDASFRRYFRLQTQSGTSLILMDAPPEKEDCRPFVAIAEKLLAVGLHCPKILEQDLQQGFLLLSDLGNTTYYQAIQDGLDDTRLQTIYREALASIVTMQKVKADDLPVYDKPRLLAELSLFPEWYIQKYLGVTLSEQEEQQLQAIFEFLATHNDQQAKVFVHRDYHSPNLMITPENNPGVIDFQDAVLGPITYDIASLVMDARTTWEEPQQLDWAIRYWEMAKAANLPVPQDFADFHVDYEYMSLQRNLRILGVFARLALRDNKKHYLDHMPRMNAYVRQVAARYQVFKPLLRLLDRLDNKDIKIGYTF